MLFLSSRNSCFDGFCGVGSNVEINVSACGSLPNKPLF